MINKIKGTKDYNPSEFWVKNLLYTTFTDTVARFGYAMIETPIFESSALFKRSAGDSSDIVKKEMYEFIDKGDREISLRPEGTASFVRAFIENKWYGQNMYKFAYFGPMFRYEQPQKGRYRQFYQAGVEFVGDKNYLKDAEVIYLGVILLKQNDIKYTLKINSIGDEQTRANYSNALKEFLQQYKEQLSVVSQERLVNGNVLRILDDKVDSKLSFMKQAPKLENWLSEESKQYFQNLCHVLDLWEIDYQIDHSLVRGLDYYDEIVFEFVAKDLDSAQSTLIGGGRYSNLIHQLGGPQISSVGFGYGIDRAQTIIYEKMLSEFGVNELFSQAQVYVAATLSQSNLEFLAKLTNYVLRPNVESLYLEYELVKPKKLFEKATKLNAEVIVYDDKMLESNLLAAKHLPSKDVIVFPKTFRGAIHLLNFLNDHEIVDPNNPYYENIIKDLMGEDDE